jgi:long-chain acyl-CoA synthetase
LAGSTQPGFLQRFYKENTLQNRPWHTHYDPGMPDHLEYPAVSVDHLLLSSALKFPHNLALSGQVIRPPGIDRCYDYTYQQLNNLVDHFAAGLQLSGLAKGDRIALYLPNSPAFVIAYYGGLRAGGIVTPINYLHTAQELARQLQDSGAAFIVLTDEAMPRLAAVQEQAELR